MGVPEAQPFAGADRRAGGRNRHRPGRQGGTADRVHQPLRAAPLGGCRSDMRSMTEACENGRRRKGTAAGPLRQVHHRVLVFRDRRGPPDALLRPPMRMPAGNGRHHGRWARHRGPVRLRIRPPDLQAQPENAGSLGGQNRRESIVDAQFPIQVLLVTDNSVRRNAQPACDC